MISAISVTEISEQNIILPTIHRLIVDFNFFNILFSFHNSQGYYRQAIALQCMGRHAEALAAYASALAHDEKSQQLLQALVEASLKSNLQGTFIIIISVFSFPPS